MKREGTIGVGALLALAAAVGISIQSPPKPGAEEGARRGNTVIRQTQHKSSGCDDLREHLEDFLDAEGALFPTPCDKGTATPLNSESRADLKFVIATLPDPLHTHLSNAFDQSTAAIQEAAQDEGYDFDSSWLPWEQEKEEAYSRLDDQKQAYQERDDREKQPGVLLFRKASDDSKEPTATGASATSPVPRHQAGPHELGKQRLEQAENQKNKNAANGPQQVAFVNKYQQGLVVFVVGEDATHGIHRQEFRNALKWIEMLSIKGLGRRDRVMILGPSFSGSFASLAELLSEPEIAKVLNLTVNDGRALPVYAGAVSGSSSATWFQQQMKQKYGQTPPRVLFHSFVQNDDQIVERFLNYMKEGQKGFEKAKVAILSEDETAYGKDVMEKAKPGVDQAKQSQPLKLFYPRDISALRGAYQSRSLFDNGSSDETQAPRRSLPTNLADPSGIVHDSIHSYGGNQTPLAQEAFLLQIVNALRERGTRYVLLRGSNPLDQLFLTDFLHRLYPDGRLVIVTSDLLFIRERGATGLSGVMTLSTYPLSSLTRHWTERPPLPAADRVFSSDGSEALYNALRLLINADYKDRKHPQKCHVSEPEGQDTAGAEDKIFLPPVSCIDSPIGDYAPPLWIASSSCTETDKKMVCSYPGPPVWLSVIGVNRFWPLVPLGSEPASDQIPACDQKNVPSQGLLRLPLVMKLALLALVGFSLFHLFCCARGSYMAKPAFRAYFAASGDPKQTALVWLGSTLVAVLGIVAGWNCGVFHSANVVMPYSWLACFCTVAVGLLSWSACILHNRRVKQLNPTYASKREGRDTAARFEKAPADAATETIPALAYRRVRRWASSPLFRMLFTIVVPLAAILLFISGFVIPLESALRPENRVLTYWRSMNLGNGLSPIVPFFSLFIGLYIVFWYSLHGLALLGPDRPRLPRPKQLEFAIVSATKPEDTPNPDSELPATNQKTAEDDNKQILRMFTQDAADDIEFVARPLTFARRIKIRSKNGKVPKSSIHLAVKSPVGILSFLLFAAVGFGFVNAIPIRSLGHENYTRVFLLWLLLSASLMVAMCWRMYQTWGEVRQLLEYLDRMTLRRTMEAVRGFSWGSVWKMSGNVLEVRYKLISRQLESMNHTIASLKRLKFTDDDSITPECAAALLRSLKEMHEAGQHFAKWYLKNYTNALAGDLTVFRTFQKRVANVCGSLLRNLLLPSWRAENESLVLIEKLEAGPEGTAKQVAPLAKQDYVRNAEEFVCLTYLGFVQNILGRLRTMAISIVVLSVSCCIAISCYPFDPRQALSAAMIALFMMSSATLVFVYAGMHRDATLSHVTNTTPGELGYEFWMKLLVFVAPPLLGLLTRVFPGMTDFFFAWLQPGLSSLK
jgi:hypothetical protein